MLKFCRSRADLHLVINRLLLRSAREALVWGAGGARADGVTVVREHVTSDELEAVSLVTVAAEGHCGLR